MCPAVSGTAPRAGGGPPSNSGAGRSPRTTGRGGWGGMLACDGVPRPWPGSHTDLWDGESYGHSHADKESREQDLRRQRLGVAPGTVEALHQEPVELTHLQPPALQLAAALADLREGFRLRLCAGRWGLSRCSPHPPRQTLRGPTQPPPPTLQADIVRVLRVVKEGPIVAVDVRVASSLVTTGRAHGGRRLQ